MRRPLTSGPVVPNAEMDETRTEIYHRWLMLAIFFEYARPGAFVPALQAAKVTTLIPLSLFAIVLFAPGLRPFRQIFADRQVRWLSVFIGLMALSAPFAVVTERAFTIFTSTLGYYFLFLIIVRTTTSWRRLRGLLVTLIFAHLFLIAMTPDIILNTSVRSYIAGGTFLGDGNDFALSLCILVPCCVALAAGSRQRIIKILAWISMLVFVLAIVGSQSRGATIGLISVAAFLWLLSRRKVASLAVMAVVGTLMMFHASDAYFDRMSTISTYQSEGSAQGRIIAWKAGVRMALDNPVLGVGLGHFPIAFGTTHRPKEFIGPMPWLTAHSSYFLVLGELGFPGIVTLLALVLGGLRTALLTRRRVLQSGAGASPGDAAHMLYLLSAAMIGFAVPGAFLSAAYYPHIFVLTGLLFSGRSIALAELEKAAAAAAAGARSTGGIRPGVAATGRGRFRTRRGSGT